MRHSLAAGKGDSTRKSLFYLSPTQEERRLRCPKAAFALSRTVPMHHFDPVVGASKALADIFRNHHRAVLASGTAECNRQVAFALVNVMGDQVDQQIGDASNEFASLRERTDVFRDALITPGKRPELRNEVGIGEKPDIENQIGIFRNALTEAEADAGNQQPLLRGLLLETLRDKGT